MLKLLLSSVQELNFRWRIFVQKFSNYLPQLVTDVFKKYEEVAKERMEKDKDEREEAEKRRQERVAKKREEEARRMAEAEQEPKIKEITDEEAEKIQKQLDQVRLTS